MKRPFEFALILALLGLAWYTNQFLVSGLSLNTLTLYLPNRDQPAVDLIDALRKHPLSVFLSSFPKSIGPAAILCPVAILIRILPDRHGWPATGSALVAGILGGVVLIAKPSNEFEWLEIFGSLMLWPSIVLWWLYMAGLTLRIDPARFAEDELSQSIPKIAWVLVAYLPTIALLHLLSILIHKPTPFLGSVHWLISFAISGGFIYSLVRIWRLPTKVRPGWILLAAALPSIVHLGTLYASKHWLVLIAETPVALVTDGFIRLIYMGAVLGSLMLAFAGLVLRNGPVTDA